MSTKTCLRCAHYMNCTDEKKSFSYRCHSYKEDSDSKFVLDLGAALVQTKHPLFASGDLSAKEIAEELAEDNAKWFKADAAMSKIVNEKRLVSPDVRIPEDDFPKAPNFYTWCKSDKFLKQTPYLVQAMMGSILFGEACPCCSDKHYIEGGYKVDDSLTRFERKVALLEDGVCPYCHRTKNKLHKKYGLKNYREFAAACGQRCVVGDTLVLTSNGLAEIGDFATGRPVGYSDFTDEFHNGTALEPCAQYFIAEPEYCYEVETALGFSVIGTADHPLMTVNGFVKIADLVPGTGIRICYGQQVFGNNDLSPPQAISLFCSTNTIPNEILQANRGVQRSVLSSLIASNGKFYSASRKTINRVSAMLLNFGIRHTIGFTEDEYVLTLTYSGRQVFDYEILWSATGRPAVAGYFYDQVTVKTRTKEKHVTYDVTLPETHQFITNGILSHNSGKSAFAGMCFSYLTHRHIKLIRPTEIYGVMDSEVFHGTFVALTFKQAFDTLWTNYHGALMDSPWFSSYHSMLEAQERKYGEGSLFRLKDTFVLYRHRSLYVYPAAPDVRSLRGRTRVLGGIDELGWIPVGGDAEKNVKLNADGIYKAMERSLLTVRASASKHFRAGQPDIPSGFFINISSPSSPRDKIMSLVNDSQLSEHIYGINKPTWEMNPHIGREDLAPEFEKDHIAAMRDYGAQPPLTGSPFISNPDTIVECFGKNKNGLKLEHHTIKSSKKDTYEIYSSVERIHHRGKPSVLALDAGVVNNSFAFALGHLGKDMLPVISMLGEIIPHAGMRINYSMAFRRFLAPIIEGCNVKLLAADRWNSLKILSDAEAEFEIQTVQHSLKYKEIIMLRSYMEDGSLTLPRPSSEDIDKILKFEHAKYPLCFRDKPADHLVVQLLTVQDTGSAVIKGDGLTDDLARAVMLCVNQLVDEANIELLSGPEKTVAQRIDMSQMMVYKGLSGGGTSGAATNVASASGKAIGFLKT